MKKKLCVLISAIFAMFAVFGSCGFDDGSSGGGSDKTSETTLTNIEKYGIDKTNLYGFFEPLWEKRGNTDEDQIVGFDLDVTIDLMSAMGTTSLRLAIPAKIFETYYIDYETEEIEIKLDAEMTEYFHSAIKKLRAAGIKCLVGEAIVDPPFVTNDGKSFSNGSLTFPTYGTDDAYDFWLMAVTEGFKTLSEEFYELTIWETGNEYNTDPYMHPSGYNYATKEGGFGFNELAALNTDYLYYATKGIKEGNPNAVSLTPGWTSGGEMVGGDVKYFLESVYANISSGEYPRVGEKSTDTDDYFGGLAYHPYTFSSFIDSFVKLNDEIYDVAIANGDIGKKVYFTEMGWFDDNAQAKIERQCVYIEKLYKACLEDMWYVESCMYFRFYNCNYDWSGGGEGGPEKSFGVFYEPTDEEGFAPKTKAEKMKEIFGGTGDLYMWNDLDALNEKIASRG